jgi:septal ring factor EnvC (AmiA/AmiB activator)
MPTAAGQPIFEDVVALLQTNPNAMVVAQHLDIITGGLVDLANRVRNLEHASLVNAEAIRVANGVAAKQETRLASVETDRDTAKAQLEKIEAEPAQNTQRLDDLDKRVRAVEGAVGSTSFAAAKAAPETPPLFKGPDATAPISNP